MAYTHSEIRKWRIVRSDYLNCCSLITDTCPRASLRVGSFSLHLDLNLCYYYYTSYCLSVLGLLSLAVWRQYCLLMQSSGFMVSPLPAPCEEEIAACLVWSSQKLIIMKSAFALRSFLKLYCSISPGVMQATSAFGYF
jgi:hypothetical protein